jgi:3-dehydroquinate synthetase
MLIALGGGVIGDLVGFAASTLLRGVPLVHIPTTLLSQVDSSVGGKTAINTASGKNLVGTFYQPKRVLIDINTLDSLPDRQMRAGYAEVVKYAALGDETFMNWLEANGKKLLAHHSISLTHAIKLCCSMKAELVEWDEKENNMRALLNLGHTFGHALEAEAGYNGSLMHGEAIAIGMVMAARLSAELGRCDAEVETRIASHLKAVGLPVSPKDISGVDWNTDGICSHFASDKKAQDGKLAFVVLSRIGDADLMRDVPPAAARKVVEAFV